MKRNRVVTLIAGMILTTTLAVSAPLTVFGTDVFDNAGSGDTEFAEDSQFAEPEELPEEDTSWDEQFEGDMTGTDFMDGDSTEGDIPDEDISEEDGSGMELPEEDITDESEDIVEPVIYTVKYDMNGHGDSYTEEVEEGAYAVDWADSPEEEGYTFLGWFADKKCTTLWDSNAPVSSDVTVYAGWEKIEEEVEEEEVQEEVVEEEAGQEETDQNDSQNTTEISGDSNTEEENSGSGSATVEEVVEKPEEEDVSEDAGAATETPAEDKTETPAEDKTETPAEDKTETPAADKTETPAEDKTETPAADKTETPANRNAVIITQPKGVSVEYPQGAEFSVKVKDGLESVEYQWYDKNDEKLILETSDSLVISSTSKDDDGASYYCVVTYEDEGVEYTETSKKADLSITNKSIIKKQPEEQSVSYSGKAVFSVETVEVTDSDKYSYRWYKLNTTTKKEEMVFADTANTNTLVIDPVTEKEDGCSFYCKVSYSDYPVSIEEESEKAVLHVTNKDAIIKTQPQNSSVEYPKGTSFKVETFEDRYSFATSYQWYMYDPKTKKDNKLDGKTATTEQLFIPSTTKNDDGRQYYCILKYKDGNGDVKIEKSEKALLTITNKDKNKPVLYVGNYAIDPSVNENGVSTLFLSDLDISTKDGDGSNTIDINGKPQDIFNSITFDSKKNLITFRNVHMSNTSAQYDHNYSPAVGIRLVVDKNKAEKYTINLIGENEISVLNAKSKIDNAASALRFDFDDAKKIPEVVVGGDGTLHCYEGKIPIVCEGNLNLNTQIDITSILSDDVTNGIECKNITLGKDSKLTVHAQGTCVYAHGSMEMKSGSNASLYTTTYDKAAKNAVLYVGEDAVFKGAHLNIIASAGESSKIDTFRGIESGGNVEISDESDLSVTVKTPGTTYGIKTGGKFKLEDSNVYVNANSSDRKGQTYGVLCGGSNISISKEKKYKVRFLTEDGIGFAALTGKTGSNEQGYQEKYTPEKIIFVATGAIAYSNNITPGIISTGSIKDGSEYNYIETVYGEKSTSAPAPKIVFESTNHELGDPVYQWSKDGKLARAIAKCKNYPSLHEGAVETVKTTSKQTKAPTCTEMGQTTYTATFTNKLFTTQTKTIADVKKTGHQFGDWVVTTKPTLTATGIKKHQCKVCKAVESAVVPKLTKGVYKIKKGADLSWTKGSDKSLEIKIVRETENDTAFSHFQGILVDGKVLNKQYYSAKSGSVIIKFRPDFMSKLAIGTHTLTFGFEDGDNPSSKLTIKNATGSNGSNSSTNNSTGTTGKGPVTSAKTGDTTNILVWVLTICAAGAAVVLIQRYKKNNKDKKDKKSDSSEK